MTDMDKKDRSFKSGKDSAKTNGPARVLRKSLELLKTSEPGVTETARSEILSYLEKLRKSKLECESVGLDSIARDISLSGRAVPDRVDNVDQLCPRRSRPDDIRRLGCPWIVRV